LITAPRPSSFPRAIVEEAIGYRRFLKAAEAIRFAIEELPPAQINGAPLDVEEARFGCDDMRRLSESSEYPLARRALR
jgi:hypothetical protein